MWYDCLVEKKYKKNSQIGLHKSQYEVKLNRKFFFKKKLEKIGFAVSTWNQRPEVFFSLTDFWKNKWKTIIITH